MHKLLNLASSASLWRGMDYYNEKRVQSWENTTDGYVGTVQGTSLYHPSIDLNHPRRSTCDCPFAADRRVICKHMVALLFVAESETATDLLNEAEDWEREEELRREAHRQELATYVKSLTKKELQEQLLSRLI